MREIRWASVALHGLGLLGLCFLAWQVAISSLAARAAGMSPELAVGFDSDNAEAQAGLAHELMTIPPIGSQSARAEQAALRALRRDPTLAPAISALGLVYDQRGDLTRARALFEYSQRISRRDLPTQLWFIEDAVAHQDIKGALRHYDIALTTSNGAPAILFPILSEALANQEIRAALVDVYGRKPPWGQSLLDYLSIQGKDVTSAALVFHQLAAIGYQSNAVTLRNLILRLGEEQQYDAAWQLYADANPDAPRTGIRNASFTTLIANPTIFDWTLRSDQDAYAEISADPGRDGALHFQASGDSGGVVASQTMLLTPGNYDLRLHLLPVGGNLASGKSVMQIRCLSGGTVAGSVVLAEKGVARGRITIPSGCSAQMLELVLRGGDGDTSVEGMLAGLSIAPSR